MVCHSLKWLNLLLAHGLKLIKDLDERLGNDIVVDQLSIRRRRHSPLFFHATYLSISVKLLHAWVLRFSLNICLATELYDLFRPYPWEPVPHQ